jgi:hypothetical protein
MKKVLLTASLFMMLIGSASAQTFQWTTNDSVVENLAQNTTVQFPLHQTAIGNDTVTLAIEIIYNDIPATWDGMVCIYGTCLGTIPVVGTTAQMNPINGALEGMVRLTVNPINGTETAKLQVYVYDIDFPNDGDTATFILNSTLSVDEVNALSTGLELYPNPATNVVQLEATANMSKAVVYDLSGKAVLSQELNGLVGTVDVSNLESGAYLMLIEDAEGNIASKKFTKK